MPWSAAILAGGRSTRMGRDKALIEVDGQPMVRRVARALRDAGADDIWAVGRRSLDAAVAGLDVQVIDDEVPDAGPLEGLITALRHARHDVTLVVPCDLLHPSPEAFRRTVEATADVAIPVVAGRAQWLHAAWHQRATLHLQAMFDAGERAIRRAVEGLDIAWVQDLAPAALADADTPDDLLNPDAGLGTSLPSDEHPRDHGS